MSESVGLLTKSDIFGRGKKAENKELPSIDEKIAEMPTEYKKQPQMDLHPLREVTIKPDWGGEKDVTASIREQFNYLATTRELELDSPRVEQLQGYADQMMAGTDKKVRVILMRRGTSPEAFAFPDGTIFINQALIDSLDTMDELVGVLGHEVHHVKNATFESSQMTNTKSIAFGVCWAHETAADLGSTIESEKLGFQSTGLASAITKITTNSRDAEHQTGDIRGAELLGAHAARHYETSDIPATPLPAGWKTDKAQPTNLDMAYELLKQNISSEQVAIILGRLTQRDFNGLYPQLITRAQLDGFAAVVAERVRDESVSEDDIKHFLMHTELANPSLGLLMEGGRDSRIIQTSEELVRLTGRLAELEFNTTLEQIHRNVFDENKVNKSPTVMFASYLGSNLFVDDGDGGRKGIPVTEDTLLAAVKNIQAVPLTNNVEKSDRRTYISTAIALFFKEKFVMPAREGNEFDTEGFQRLLAKVSEAGIDMDYGILRAKVYGVYPDDPERLFNLLPPVERETVDITSEIDSFFGRLNVKYLMERDSNQYDFNTFFRNIKTTFAGQELDDAAREVYVDAIIAKLDTYRERSKVDLNKFKQVKDGPERSEDEQQVKLRLRLQLQAVAALFDKDGPEFYRSVNGIMERAGIRAEELTPQELFQVCEPLLEGTYSTIKISDYEYFMQLPFLDELQHKQDALATPTSISDLLTHATDIRDGLPQSIFKEHIFTDKLIPLIAYRGVRNSLQTILNEGVPPEQQTALFEFIDKFLPKNPTTDRVKQKIYREALEAQTSLQDKITFLRDNFESIGFDGLTLLGEQITTMDEYQLLRVAMSEKIDEYLKPSSTTDVLAGGDVLSSKITKNFELLLRTAATDPEAKKETTTQFAQAWFKSIIENTGFDYDDASKRLGVSGDVKVAFRSMQDIFDSLQNLSQYERTAIIMKSLLDVDGALTSPDRRKKLGKLMVGGLNIEDPFIQHVMTSAVDVADAKVVGYPVSALFAKLLFSSLDTGSLDMAKVMQYHPNKYAIEQTVADFLPEEDAQRMLTSPTRNIVAFGKQFQEQPGSRAAQYALESQDNYFQTYDLFEEQFPKPVEEDQAVDSTLDQSVEAVIQGVQASGPVGVRALQIASQIREFSPEVAERLSQTFDANPGLNKLLFWENLYSFQEKISSGDERYREAGKFVAERLVSIGDKLGGGSLYTTYAAEVRDETGAIKTSVVKMLNPNAALVIESFHKLAFDTLEQVKQTGDTEAIKQAQQSLMLVELAQQWCLADINDPTFIADDDTFRDTLTAFNQQSGSERATAPDRVYNSFLVKSETEAYGRTLNKILQDETVSGDKKSEAVQTALDLFDFELSRHVISEDGQSEYLMRSDPNPGNFVVDTEGDHVKVAVIDRNLYLHLNETEARALRDLWQGKHEAFLGGFIRSVFEENNIGKLRQAGYGFQIRNFLRREVNAAGGVNNVEPLLLMQRLMDNLESKGLDVPLRMHIAIKNVFAMQELRRRTFEQNRVEVQVSTKENKPLEERFDFEATSNRLKDMRGQLRNTPKVIRDLAKEGNVLAQEAIRRQE